MWTLRSLIDHTKHCSTEINGNWVPSRPINYKCRTFMEKVEECWAVWTGRAEPFTWPEGQ